MPIDTPAPQAEPTDEALLIDGITPAQMSELYGAKVAIGEGTAWAARDWLEGFKAAREALRARLAEKDKRIAELRRLIIAWSTYFGLDADEDDMGAKKLLADTRAIIGETR